MVLQFCCTRVGTIRKWSNFIIIYTVLHLEWYMVDIAPGISYHAWYTWVNVKDFLLQPLVCPLLDEIVWAISRGNEAKWKMEDSSEVGRIWTQICKQPCQQIQLHSHLFYTLHCRCQIVGCNLLRSYLGCHTEDVTPGISNCGYYTWDFTLRMLYQGFNLWMLYLEGHTVDITPGWMLHQGAEVSICWCWG